jgi:hypothetical protein
LLLNLVRKSCSVVTWEIEIARQEITEMDFENIVRMKD